MNRLVSHRGVAWQALPRHAATFSPICVTRFLDGCNLEVFSFGNGCHMTSNSHLITWGLDTTPIGDLRCREVDRWSLDGVFRPRRPRQACRGNLETCLQCSLDLIELACPAREVFP